MSRNGEESGSAPGSDLQQAFDQAAGDLDLRVEPVVSSPEETVTIGVAIAFFSRAVDIRVDPAAPPVGAACVFSPRRVHMGGPPAAPPVDASDDDAIKGLIHGYESLDPTIYRA